MSGEIQMTVQLCNWLIGFVDVMEVLALALPACGIGLVAVTLFAPRVVTIRVARACASPASSAGSITRFDDDLAHVVRGGSWIRERRGGVAPRPCTSSYASESELALDRPAVSQGLVGELLQFRTMIAGA